MNDINSIINKNTKTKKITCESSTQTEDPRSFYKEDSVLSSSPPDIPQIPQFYSPDPYQFFSMPTVDELIESLEGGSGQYFT